MGLSVAHRLIEAHLLEGDLTPGTEIGFRIDQTLTQDATGTLVMLELKAMGLDRVRTELPASVEKIMGHFKTAGKDINGWVFTTRTGLYGTDYLQRALVTAIGLGANRSQDAIYPTSEKDVAGQPYDGANRYVMRF